MPKHVATTVPQIRPLLTVAIALIFGGCCTNAWSLERLLKDNPRVGTALTFCQLVFITLQTSPECVSFNPYPRFKPRVVPMRTWLVQVFMITSMSLLNNWAFAYRVPLTLQIVFRSAGLATSMVLGYIFLGKRYTYLQTFSVIIVTFGVTVATLSRPTSAPTARVGDPATASNIATEIRQYTIGVLMIFTSCVLTSVLGILQERTFARYGSNTWREGIFYTHLLSLPTFCLFIRDVRDGLQTLSLQSPTDPVVRSLHVKIFSSQGFRLRIPPLYAVLVLNVVASSVCVSGANLLTSEVSSVTTNLVLTARKALSLFISVWYFGQGINVGLASGAVVVLFGTVLYSYATTATQKPDGKPTASSAESKKESRRAPTPTTAVEIAEWEKETRGLATPNGSSATTTLVADSSEGEDATAATARLRPEQLRWRGTDETGYLTTVGLSPPPSRAMRRLSKVEDPTDSD